MKVKILKECGYDEALLGISLSRNQPIENMPKVANKISHAGSGHNKYLRSIQIWVDVTAPRYWWQEMATYTVGVTVQSASTIYTIAKGYLEQADFEQPIYSVIIDRLNGLVGRYNSEQDLIYKKMLFMQLKAELPEGFLQRRIMCISYAALQNMFLQRYNHKLPQWKMFLDIVVEGLEHPEFIVK